jgi:hypothetical protein
MRNRVTKFLSGTICLGLFLTGFWFPADALAGRHDTKRINRTIKWEGEKHLTVIIDIGAATIDLKRNSTGDLLNAEVEYDPDEVRVDIDYDRQKDKGELYLVSERRENGLDVDEEDNHWYLEFGDKVPISFEIDVGACEAEFDFSGLRIDGLDMDLGASSVNVEFRKPNPERISKIRIDVGASELKTNGFHPGFLGRLRTPGIRGTRHRIGQPGSLRPPGRRSTDQKRILFFVLGFDRRGRFRGSGG